MKHIGQILAFFISLSLFVGLPGGLGAQPHSINNSINNDISGVSSSGALRNPLSGDMNYQKIASEREELQLFSIPVVLPMEAQLGFLNMSSSVAYAHNRYEDENNSYTVEGPSYFSLDGRFAALEFSRLKLELTESVNVPLALNKDDNIPYEARLNTGGYVLDSGVTVSYNLHRSVFQFGMEHNWRLARNEYNPGESVAASLHFGYGFGQSREASSQWPINLMLGVVSRYNYADRLSQETVSGTEYGSVFLAPGVRFYRNSLDFWATVEVPVHHMNKDSETYRDKVRGNIGLKYYIK